MDPTPTLRTALLDLLYETRDSDIKLILGGGYGLFLKRELLQRTQTPTLFKEWPEARSTNDLDLFLRPELLIHSKRLQPLAAAIRHLGYQPIAGAEKFQFARPGPTGTRQGSLKIDLLTGPKSQFRGTKVKVDDRRVRPHPSVDLHAHHVDEAITLEQGLLSALVQGVTSGGIDWRSEIYLPHPFTFAMMKLFAYRDRNEDPDKELGRYHALDLYSIVAMMTQPDRNEALPTREANANAPTLAEAAEIVKVHFSTRTSQGALRMRESQYYRETLQLDECLVALKELFQIALDEPRRS